MRFFLVAVVLIAVVIGGYFGLRPPAPVPPPAGPSTPAAAGAADPKKGKLARFYPVRIAPIAARPVQYQLAALGSLEAQDVYQIYTAVSGTLSDVTFNEGSDVKAGQVLGRISSEQYQFTVDKQKAIYDQAVTALDMARLKYASAIQEAEINLADANQQVDRRKSVTVAGAVAPEEIQQFETKANLAAVALKSAKGLAEKGMKNLEAIVAEKLAIWNTAQDDFKKSQILALIDGTIDQRKVTNGQVVTAGTPVAILVDRRTLKLRFQVAEQESAAIKIGDTATFEVPAWPGRKFQSEIYFISNQIDPVSRVVEVYARVTRDLDALKPGFFASVEVITGGKELGVVVPVAALLPTEKGFVAFVLSDLKWTRREDKDGKVIERPLREGESTEGATQTGIAHRRTVTSGLNVTDNSVEIISGLSDKEFLVIEGASALEEGYPVRILPAIAVKAAPPAPPAPAAPAAPAVPAGAPAPLPPSVIAPPAPGNNR